MTLQKVSDHAIDLVIKELIDEGRQPMAELISGLKIRALAAEMEIQRLKKIIGSVEMTLTQITLEPEKSIPPYVEEMTEDMKIGVFARPKTLSKKIADDIKDGVFPQQRPLEPKKGDKWTDHIHNKIWIHDGEKWIVDPPAISRFPQHKKGSGGPE